MMERDEIEIKYKKGIRIGVYVLATIFLGICIYMFQAFVFGTEGGQLPLVLEIFFVAVSSLGILGCLFIIPHMYSMRIIVDSKGVKKQGLLSREFVYEEIQKIKVGNGLVEVIGAHIFDAISFGDLFTNYGEAVELLAENVEDHSQITFKGKEKYIKEYFPTHEMA